MATDEKQIVYNISSFEKKLSEFFDSILRLPDGYDNIGEIRKQAVKLADAYGRMHFYKFRYVYKKLIDKISQS